MSYAEFDAIQIGIASPEQIRAWSYGEVKRPETINYRTLKPERDGLFCERIFGPTKDWECNCGKYKKIRYKGKICDRCGVEITRSKVRRERMGHIELAAPVSHIWYFKGIPSRMGLLLDISPRILEKVLYFASYIVIDPGFTPLAKNQILSEKEYRDMREKYEDDFDAGMGAEAVKKLLQQIDLEELSTQLRAELKDASGQKKARIVKRLEVVDAFRLSGNKPEWMIIDVLPVIPPEIRPMVPLDGGRFASSDLNDLYRRVINRNNRLKRLIQLNAPDIIVRNEKRMLQEAVDALIDNGRRGRAVTGANNRALKSLSDMLKGKQGRFRQNLLGKRVDYSGRSVIVVGPELKIYQCGLPKEMAIELFRPFVMKKLVDDGCANNIKAAKKMVEKGEPAVWDALEFVIKEHPVMLNRAPTLHRLGIQAFEPVLVEGRAIKLHPLVCTAFNADFDGDQMAVHVPLSAEAQTEARILMLSANNLLRPQDGGPVTVPTQDMVLGAYYLTYRAGSEEGSREGRLPSADTGRGHAGLCGRRGWSPSRLPPSTGAACPPSEVDGVTKPQAGAHHRGPPDLQRGHPPGPGLCGPHRPGADVRARDQLRGGQEAAGQDHRPVHHQARLHRVRRRAGRHQGPGLPLLHHRLPDRGHRRYDGAPEEVRAHRRDREGDRQDRPAVPPRLSSPTTSATAWSVEAWEKTTKDVTDALQASMDRYNPIFMMADSGARGSMAQIRQLAGMRGLMADTSGRTIEIPIKSNFREGLSVLEYFISSRGARKGMADTALRTADSGYLTRRLVDVSQEVIIREDDCGTDDGITVSEIEEHGQVIETFAERVHGRYPAEDIMDPQTGEVLFDHGHHAPQGRRQAPGGARHPRGEDPLRAHLPGPQRRVRQVLRHQPGHRRACGRRRGGGHHRRPVHRRAGHPADHAYLPHRRRGRRRHHPGSAPCGGAVRGPQAQEDGPAGRDRRPGVHGGDQAQRHVQRDHHRRRRRGGDLRPALCRRHPGEGGRHGGQGRAAHRRRPVSPRGATHPRAVRVPQLPHPGGAEGVPPAGRGHQRQAHRGHHPPDDAQGPGGGRRRLRAAVRLHHRPHRVPGRRGGVQDRIDAGEKNDEGEELRMPTCTRLLMGITKASLATESFLSAASFQETTKVLTEAAIKGKVDHLLGLKENVIIGKLIPAGSGLAQYRKFDAIDDEGNLAGKKSGSIVADALEAPAEDEEESLDLLLDEGEDGEDSLFEEGAITLDSDQPQEEHQDPVL